MGMFANHADVVHPSGSDDLGDCTACGGTGWVSYPVHVSVDENEYDECPRGCRQLSDNERRDREVRRQPIPMSTIDTDLHDAYYKSLVDEHWADPLMHLQRGTGINLIGADRMSRLNPRGRITTDDPVMGLVEGPGRRVWPCTVPPYLVGTPVEHTPLVVSYEYLGSRVNVRFGDTEASFFRFAHIWEDGFSTRELIGR